ncbi:hypothetical protein MKW98_016304 [Papaver atlanticum]|uniref:Uncharacterized protein n=1 Tax=Papaver atlanticum TaxID=357466 RepID=A0AAD4SJE2_9MAGN|nr:hypothetical protein MKW98_016304 [Papaver atlanticum]
MLQKDKEHPFERKELSFKSSSDRKYVAIINCTTILLQQIQITQQQQPMYENTTKGGLLVYSLGAAKKSLKEVSM